ncbi:hypothetical protein U3516DRAFT_666691 [Neocallimastix sp. 'constans']
MWSSYTTNIKNNYNSVTNYVQIERSNYNYYFNCTNIIILLINSTKEPLFKKPTTYKLLHIKIPHKNDPFDSLTLNRTSHPLHYDRASQFYVYMPEAGGFLCIVNTR